MIGDDRTYINRKFVDVFPESMAQGVLAILDHTYRTGEPYHGVALPILLKEDNGHARQRYYDFLMQSLYEADGSTRGLITIVLDVTEQVLTKNASLKQQEKIFESEARFRQLADSMPQIVWTASADGNINYTNLRWAAYSGSSDQLKWLNSVHPDDRETAIQNWKNSVELGIAFEVEVRLIRKLDLSPRWHLARAVQVRDAQGNVAAWFGTCTDIQDQKETQAELILAKANAEAANFAKTSFLANMSHEIRTPLGVILGFTDLLANSDLGEQEKRHLDVIVRSGKTLTRLIEDILDISKIEAGKLLIENIQFTPAKILKEVVELFQERAKNKSITLDLVVEDSVPEFLVSDPSRLRQILINIIGNAVKFTTVGFVKVDVSATHTHGQDYLLRIKVSDTGVGIDNDQAERLFQPFSQAESGTNRKFGGTGLGLVISLKLAKALGGTLRLTHFAPDKGCTFEIEIRAQSPELVTSTSNAIKNSEPKKFGRLKSLRVLGIDDAEDNRTLMKFLLEREGAEFTAGASGEFALATLERDTFDIVLMDIQMPGLDGYQTIVRLRERGYQGPVIALTAYAMVTERDQALSTGFDDHVTKPIDVNTLIDTILKHRKNFQKAHALPTDHENQI